MEESLSACHVNHDPDADDLLSINANARNPATPAKAAVDVGIPLMTAGLEVALAVAAGTVCVPLVPVYCRSSKARASWKAVRGLFNWTFIMRRWACLSAKSMVVVVDIVCGYVVI